MNEEEDDDEYKALKSRFSFREAKFSRVFRALQDIGWTFRQREARYVGPSFPDLLTSAQICDILDESGVVDIFSDLQDEDGDVCAKHQTLREQVWKAYHRRFIASKKNEDDDDDSKMESTVTTKSSSSSSAGNARRSARSKKPTSEKRTVTVMEKGSDLYLHKNTKKRRYQTKKITSNNYDSVRPSLKECRAFVDSNPDDEHTLSLEASYGEQYDAWNVLLASNHNLILYGAGSKRNVLDSYLQSLESDASVLTIEGSDTSCSVSSLLNFLVDTYLDGKEPEGVSAIPLNDYPDISVIGKITPWRTDSLSERSIAIGRTLALELETCVYIGVHNLDSSPLVASSRSQQALALLTSNSTVANGASAVRLVATVNHVDAPNLLFTSTSAQFQWSYQLVPTQRPFGDELFLLEDKLVNLSSTAAASSSGRTVSQRRALTQARTAERAVSVLQNLAPRHAEIVQILARLQLEKKQEWIDYSDYFKACKMACAVTKDAQLRHFLTELLDHELVEHQEKKVRVPFEHKKLKEIVALKKL